MCDYSLHCVASRAAQAAETLMVTNFRGTSTRGFASPGDPTVAVCLRPGTEIAFEKDVEANRPIGFLPRRKLPYQVARFRQLNMDQPHTHHDALEFPDGGTLMVTQLSVGQKATVLQLPAEAQPAAEREVRAEIEPPRTVTVFGS